MGFLSLTTGEPYELVSYRPCGTCARVGLFETNDDVTNCVNRTDAQIQSLDKDMMDYGVSQYGPDGYASSISADKLAKFLDDKKFYQDWLAFKASWDEFATAWRASPSSVLSADKYRDCQKFDAEQKAWQDRFTKRGGKVTAPKTVTPSPIPGVIPQTAPDEKSNVPWTWIAAGIVLIGAAMLLGQAGKLTGAT